MKLARRAEATELTLARYRDRPFDWAKGATCIHMARFQARNLGHRPPAMPRFRSATGAKTALKQIGHNSVEDLLDSLFVRIPPARMLVGDLAMLPGEEALGSIVIFDGLSKLLGWHATEPGGIRPIANAMDHVRGAWRL